MYYEWGDMLIHEGVGTWLQVNASDCVPGLSCDTRGVSIRFPVSPSVNPTFMSEERD